MASCSKGGTKRGNGEVVAQMGWEQRGYHRYYYRKEREGSRVKSTYVGRGEIASLISQFQDESDQLERLIGIGKPSLREEWEQQDARIEKICRLIVITQAALLSAGFHTRKRQWRKTLK